MRKKEQTPETKPAPTGVGVEPLVMAPLPCPFCGAPAEEGGDKTARWVSCSRYKTGCTGKPCTGYYSSRNKAVEAWNIRIGWELIAKTYVPRELTIDERHQFEMAALRERQAKEKHFALP